MTKNNRNVLFHSLTFLEARSPKSRSLEAPKENPPVSLPASSGGHHFSASLARDHVTPISASVSPFISPSPQRICVLPSSVTILLLLLSYHLILRSLITSAMIFSIYSSIQKLQGFGGEHIFWRPPLNPLTHHRQ